MVQSVSNPEWQLLQECNKSSSREPLRVLMNDSERCSRLVVRACGIELDASRDLIDSAEFERLLQFGDTADLDLARAALFGGERINTSEDRPALHTALRAAKGDGSSRESMTAGEGLVQMEQLIDSLNSGGWANPRGQRFTDFINIGIGGSDLGPRLVCQAVAPTGHGPRVHFLSNLDGTAATRLMASLNPATTAVQVTSKSFGTQETLTNARTIRRWIEDSTGADAGDHFMAVSTNRAAAQDFGISPERILPMWDWVGGRYSVWSPAGFAAAVGIGMPRFHEFLAGARAMDNHFRDAPTAANLPIMLALLGIWYRNVLQAGSLAVVPYAEELRLLPAYLQQLEMESNGKSVRTDGEPAEQHTSPVIWGGTGTDVQHAFFQMLHQGTGLVPMHLIGIVQPDHGLTEHHQMLLANLFAQAQALARGRNIDEVDRILQEQGMAPEERHKQLPHRSYAGNKPSSLLLLDEISPRALGSLLALYEHKVFIQGWIWGINPFDQWGVELGKSMAGAILPALRSGERMADVDPVSQRLVDRVRTLLR